MKETSIKTIVVVGLVIFTIFAVVAAVYFWPWTVIEEKVQPKVKITNGYWFVRLGEEKFDEGWNLCYSQTGAGTYPGLSDDAARICEEIMDEGIRRWRDRKLQDAPAVSKKIEALRDETANSR